eukprot:TRINITY_DN32185_c0_g1_i1.p1 TRINITY_DN32185_c0_g1~~TRINITY_DN32185_c0_g1_i1.p1  ORF type:complete len:385 (-),score=56.18 TRINITY_DN32185_c0_g1_i1:128-1249(-)
MAYKRVVSQLFTSVNPCILGRRTAIPSAPSFIHPVPRGSSTSVRRFSATPNSAEQPNANTAEQPNAAEQPNSAEPNDTEDDSFRWRGWTSALAAAGLATLVVKLAVSSSSGKDEEASGQDESAAPPQQSDVEQELILMSPEECADLGVIDRILRERRGEIPPPGYVLPPAPPYPAYYPFTMVVDANFFFKFDLEQGLAWRRPGLEMFCKLLTEYDIEFVIWTDGKREHYTRYLDMMFADADTDQVPMFINREEAYVKDGIVYKDVRFLNRDPARLLVIDTHKHNFDLQPDNVILSAPFDGESSEPVLQNLLEFIEVLYLAEAEELDLRPVIKALNGKDFLAYLRAVAGAAQKKAIEDSPYIKIRSEKELPIYY